MTGTPEEIIKWLFTQDRDKVFDCSLHRDKRSRNANAYAWELIGKIADSLRSSKEEVYLNELKKYGQSEIISVVSTIDISGFIKYFEPIGTGHVQGKEFTHYKVYKGSSEYDTREMSILIDGIIQDAEELDIETLPPAKVEMLKEMWGR